MKSKSYELKMCVLGTAASPHTITRALIFRELGYKVVLISPVPYKGTDMGIKIVFPRVQRNAGVFRNALTMFRTLRLVWQQEADVYFAHYAAEVTTWAAALTFRKLLVINVMGGDVLSDQHKGRSLINKVLTRFALRRADLVTVKSAQLKRVVCDLGVSDSRIMNIYWGVDRNIFRKFPCRAEVRRKWGITESEHVLFSPRMLQPLYNQHLIIEAMPAILKEYPYTILMVSTFEASKEYFMNIECQVHALGIERNVRFISSMAISEMVKAYSASDVVISIPFSDGFPQTIFEAMACEVPVIISNLEHYKDLMRNEENSLIVDLCPAEIARATSSLFADGNLKNKLILNGKVTVSKHADLGIQAKHIDDRIRELIHRRFAH